MTSERKRAANRANAARSTGPRTPTGKARAARNARKHGLNTRAGDERLACRVAELVPALVDEPGFDPARAGAAAEAQAHLERIQALKAQVLQIAIAEARAAGDVGPEALEAVALASVAGELLTLDGYERKARSRARRLFAGS